MVKNTASHITTYVLACPSAQPQCAIAPNMTLTAGTDVARWTSATTGVETSGYVPCLPFYFTQ